MGNTFQFKQFFRMEVNRSLLISLLLVAVVSKTIVEGARCERSIIGSTFCQPCGKGSRCHSCDWCTGYCFGAESRTRNDTEGKEQKEYGSVEAPYKNPFFEMFNDIHDLLTVDGIPDQYVVDLYKEASVVTREDCTICNNSPELNILSNFTEKVHEELKNIIGTVQFRPKAIEKTTETKNLVQNLPDSLKIKVEPNSSILKSIPHSSGKNFGVNSLSLQNDFSGEFILKIGCLEDSYNVIHLTQDRSAEMFKAYLR